MASQRQAFWAHIPFIEHLGIELWHTEGGQSRLEWSPGPEHRNSFEVAHGGAVMTLLDVTMVAAARSVQPDMGMVTIEMKTSFMRPGTGRLVCEGRLLHRTATLAFVEATLRNGQGEPCAHATGTFKYIRRLPTGPASVNELSTPTPSD